MKNRNWFWGIIFVLSAIFVIAGQTGSFGEIGIVSISAGILLLAIIIQSLINLNFFGVFLPVAFLYMIFRQPYHFPYISPWLLILSSVLVSIGFSIIFRVHPKNYPQWNHRHWHHRKEHLSQTGETIDDNHPYLNVKFSSSSKYLRCDCLESGQFSVSFGELEVYFDKAQLSPTGAEIFLDCNFGAIKLFVPKHWRVVDKMQVNLAGVDNNTRNINLGEDAPLLTLSGNVQLGAIEIQYI